MNPRITRATVATLFIGSFVMPAQADDAKKEALKRAKEHFSPARLYSVSESYPYGPGDRTIEVLLNLLPGETATNTEQWVLYSTDKSLLTGARVGSDFPHGKARITTRETPTSSLLVATFIFPHADHKKPNASDVKPTIFSPGRTVHYKWIKKKGTSQTDSEIVTFKMPDQLTIANLGDSYASGEGAPYISGPKWDVDKCHRNGNSGQARAVTEFKSGNPGVAVDFKNVACSGAGVDEGIIGHQYYKHFFQHENHATPIDPQIKQVGDWLDDKDHDTVNIALLSIGINDCGFAGIVQDYFIGLGNLVGDQAKRVRIANDVKGLVAHYKHVKAGIDESFDYDHVVVSQYPDLSHDQHGHLNGRLGELHGLCWGAVEATSDDEEYRFLSNTGRSMNETIGSVVKTFPKWRHGDEPSTSKHGLANCEEPWFNTIGASLFNQGDASGTFHPNRTGHREFVRRAIGSDLADAYSDLAEQSLDERRADAKLAAKEMAKRKAKAKALAAARAERATITENVRASTARPTAFPADVLQKARAAASTLRKDDEGEDNKDVGDGELN